MQTLCAILPSACHLGTVPTPFEFGGGWVSAYKAALDLHLSPVPAPDDGRGVFWSKAHRLAFDRLGFAAKSRAPLTIFTGEPGTGRSTLIRELARHEKAERITRIIPDPARLSGDTCAAVLEVFGEPHEPDRRDLNCAALAAFLKTAASDDSAPLLVIDDADGLSEDALSALCFFATGGLDEGPRLKLVLVGPPSLHDRINRAAPDLVGPSFELGPMTREDTADYVRHIVKAAGGRPDAFDAEAMKDIFDRTNGVPKRIDALRPDWSNAPPDSGAARTAGAPARVVNLPTSRITLRMPSGDAKPRTFAPQKPDPARSQRQTLPRFMVPKSKAPAAPTPDQAGSATPPAPPGPGSNLPVAPTARRAPATVLASILHRSGSAGEARLPLLILTVRADTEHPPPAAPPAPASGARPSTEAPALAPPSRPAGWRLEAIALILLATVGAAAHLTEPGTPFETRLSALRDRAETLFGAAPSRIAPAPTAAPESLAAASPRTSADQFRTAPAPTAAPESLGAASPRTSADQFRSAPSRTGPAPTAAPDSLGAASPRTSADQFRTPPSRTGPETALGSDHPAARALAPPKPRPRTILIRAANGGDERTGRRQADRNRGDRADGFGRNGFTGINRSGFGNVVVSGNGDGNRKVVRKGKGGSNGKGKGKSKGKSKDRSRGKDKDGGRKK
nr:AAA family ATPase [Defluviimonas salinarum]